MSAFASRGCRNLRTILLLVIACGGSGAFAQPAPANRPQQQISLRECLQAPAGPVREIRTGVCLRSSLGDEDPTANGVRYEDYQLPLLSGQSIQIDMEAIPVAAAADQAGPPQNPPAQAQIAVDPIGFDTYLELRLPDQEDPLSVNDDRGGSLNSRLVFRAPQSRTYVIRARALYQGTGDYVLAVRTLPDAPAPVAISGDRVVGRLGEGSPVSETRDNYRYALHSFRGAAGERVRLRLGSESSNGLVLLSDAEGRLLSEGYGSELTAQLPRSGEYIVRVELPAQTAAANYTLAFDRAREVQSAAPTRIAVGDTITGELGLQSGVEQVEDGSGAIAFFYTLYAIDVQAGDVLTVTLRSDDFDPVVEAGVFSPIGFAVAEANDDSDRLNSRLVLRPQSAGTLVLRPRSLGVDLGAFTLAVSRGEP